MIKKYSYKLWLLLSLASTFTACNACDSSSPPTSENQPPSDDSPKPAVTQAMLDKVQAEINKSNLPGHTWLLKVLQELKDGKKTNINQQSGTGLSTALWEAVNLGLLDIVKALVEAGANVNGLSFRNQTPLYKAVEAGNREMVDYLCSKGADKTIVNQDSMKTPSQVAKEFSDADPGNQNLKYIANKLNP